MKGTGATKFEETKKMQQQVYICFFSLLCNGRKKTPMECAPPFCSMSLSFKKPTDYDNAPALGQFCASKKSFLGGEGGHWHGLS
jgi:hypothetical protein